MLQIHITDMAYFIKNETFQILKNCYLDTVYLGQDITHFELILNDVCWGTYNLIF